MKAFQYVIAAVCLIAEPAFAGNCAGGCGGAAATTCSSCNGGVQSTGSLSDYPGGCCKNEDKGNCCASLWADYCRDKKPCWTPNSPRRSALAHGGCGVGCEFLRHPCLTGRCASGGCSSGSCAPASDCDTASSAACDGADLGTSAGTPGCDLQPTNSAPAITPIPDTTSRFAPLNTSPDDYPPADTVDPPKQLAPDVPQPAPLVAPETGSEARRHMLPFGLNSPSPKRTFPFDSKPTAKRNSFPFAR